MTANIFEIATRNKIRFSSTKGDLSVEQIWDVPLRSKDDFNLDTIAKATNKAFKAATEESFVETTRTPTHDRLETSLAIVKHVIAVKLAEEQEAKTRAARRAEKAELLAILAEKQKGAMSALSEAEIQKRIAALGD